MRATQQAAFQAGAGISANAVLIGVASIVMVLIFIWALWVTFGMFRAWHEGNATLFDLAWSALRASIVVMALGFYVR